MAHAGAKVALAARDRAALDTLAGAIRAEGGDALPVVLDVRDLKQINAAVEQVVAHYGQLDILVNNAGLGANHTAVNVTEADWDEMMDVNLKGLFFCCQAAGGTCSSGATGASST